MKTYTQLTREKRYQMFVLLTFGAQTVWPQRCYEFCDSVYSVIQGLQTVRIETR